MKVKDAVCQRTPASSTGHSSTLFCSCTWAVPHEANTLTIPDPHGLRNSHCSIESRYSFDQHLGEQLVQRDREITDALACGMVDGVGERGSDADEANLANTFGTHGIQRL